MYIERLKGLRVLVLGGAGFLGARIVRKLCLAGISPYVVTRSLSRMHRIQDIAPFCKIDEVDLTNLDSFSKLVRKAAPDVIFYAVGHGTHKGQISRQEMFDNNILVTHNLLEVTKTLPDCKIVYSGTSLEQGKMSRPIIEDGLANPQSFYAATKTAALVLVRHASKYDERKIVTLIPFAIYGMGEPSTRLIPTAIRAGLNGSVLHLTKPGFVRDYVFVDDVADAYLKAATNEQALGKRINIAGGVPVSNEAVVAIIEKELNLKIDKRVGEYHERETDTQFWCANIEKSKAVLDWQPSHTLEVGIRSTIQWFQKNGFHD